MFIIIFLETPTFTSQIVFHMPWDFVVHHLQWILRAQAQHMH